jgi:hypothetical protein
LKGLAQVLDQNNTVLARANDVEMKDALLSINDPRLHGVASPTRREHAFGIGNSWWCDCGPRLFQLFPFQIADTDKLTAREAKIFDLHFVPAV